MPWYYILLFAVIDVLTVIATIVMILGLSYAASAFN